MCRDGGGLLLSQHQGKFHPRESGCCFPVEWIADAVDDEDSVLGGTFGLQFDGGFSSCRAVSWNREKGCSHLVTQKFPICGWRRVLCRGRMGKEEDCCLHTDTPLEAVDIRSEAGGYLGWTHGSSHGIKERRCTTEGVVLHWWR